MKKKESRERKRENELVKMRERACVYERERRSFSLLFLSLNHNRVKWRHGVFKIRKRKVGRRR